MGSEIVRSEEVSSPSEEGAIKKRSSGRRPKKMAAHVTPEEAYFRNLTPVCDSCGQRNTVFRYFNNRYRTPGSRVSSLDQPRYRCISPCNYEFTLRTGGRSISKKKSTRKKKTCKTTTVESTAHYAATNNVGSPSDHHQEFKTDAPDDPIMLLWNCQITMPETGAYVYPTLMSTTCAPTIFNSNCMAGAPDDLIVLPDDPIMLPNDPIMLETGAFLDPTISTTGAPTSASPRMFETDTNIASSLPDTASDEAILQYLAHELLWDDDMLPELQEQPLSTDVPPLDSAQVAPLSTSNLVDHHHHSDLMMMMTMMMGSQHSCDNVPPDLRDYFAILQHIL